MSHHGDRPFDSLDIETARRMSDVMKPETVARETEKFRRAILGDTKTHPEGKIAPGDEGEIAFAVGSQHGKVIIEFGKPVAWMGMNPQQAIALANTLLKHAKDCRIIGKQNIKIRHKANTQ
ncbi:MAG: hypothetical protein V3V73_05980 [Gammaproteobacteria bacterium]